MAGRYGIGFFLRMYELSEAAMMETDLNNARMIRLAVWGDDDAVKRLAGEASTSPKTERRT